MCEISKMDLNVTTPASSLEVPLHQTGQYGVKETMKSAEGLSGVKSTLVAAHPLEASEALVRKNRDQVDFTMLRNVQGMHAPLRLQMERHIAGKVQRLPCLHSSNVALDTLRGQDEHIDFNHVLNDPTAPEVMGDPHIMIERRAGILQ
ncbi:POMP [Branchiostoma lanceolatum]|uniref:POMP protein n=1 Tax=Branchiostoma lanceolatum TaxID=7740 RepID=A0A8K0A5F7_BRALA|nr:POMP [Branchiostoma lanceolatum]